MFDIDSFIHEHNDIKYIIIEEIFNVEQTRTHLVNYDMHGIRNETCSLFSYGDLELLLHDDNYDSTTTSILFIKRFSNKYDDIKEWKVSALFVSTTPEDTNILKNLAIAKILEYKQTEELLWKLLTKRIIDNKQVIAFDNAAWKDLKSHIMNDELSDQVPKILKSCNQMMVLRYSLGISSISKKLPGLLNSQPYLVLTPMDVSKIKNGERLNKPTSSLPKEIDFSPEKLQSEVRKLKSVLNHVTKKLDIHIDNLKK